MSSESKASFAAFVDYTANLDLYKSEKPYELYQVEGLSQAEMTNVVYEPTDISSQLEDIRGREADFTLQEHSFCFIKHTSKIPITTEDDMMHPYANEVNSLLKEVFGSSHAICYDLRVSLSVQAVSSAREVRTEHFCFLSSAA